jgi:hypothetical protein
MSLQQIFSMHEEAPEFFSVLLDVYGNSVGKVSEADLRPTTQHSACRENHPA